MSFSAHFTSAVTRGRRTATPAQGRSADPPPPSPTSPLFMKAIQSLQELPEVREGRVRELRALVATGTYRVNADAVAAGILREIAHLEHTDASES